MTIKDVEFKDGVYILQLKCGEEPVSQLYLLYEQSFMMASELIGRLAAYNDVELSGKEVILAIKMHFELEYAMYLIRKAKSYDLDDSIKREFNLNVTRKNIGSVVKRFHRQNQGNYRKLCSAIKNRGNDSTPEIFDYETFNNLKIVSYKLGKIQKKYHLDVADIFNNCLDDEYSFFPFIYKPIPEDIEAPAMVRVSDFKDLA